MHEDEGKVVVKRVVERRRRKANPAHLTPAWLYLFKAFEANHGKAVRKVCHSRHAALRLRLEFYKARSALLADPLNEKPPGGPHPFINTMNMQVLIEDEATVVFQLRMDSGIERELEELVEELEKELEEEKANGAE